MSRLAENLVDIFKVVGNDEDLLRLTYYKDNPLDPNKSNVKDLPDFYEIRKERIIRAPKTDDISTKELCRICMYFGNGSNTSNERVDDQDIVIDVYTHIDTFELNEARSLKIIDKLNKLITFQHITGVGKIRSSRRYIIGNPPNGYIGYKVTYTFGSGK
ncbi:hypothetical protein [Metabacillus sp. Hm71]|uniref:hypothetical protein n=1 Tax=Metabacillus sp. Hm71 TaxID=3450743 RepID=UPI003F432378